MPSTGKSATTDLGRLLKTRNDAGIEFILVGGLAAVVQGAPVTTFDLGIVPKQPDDNIQLLKNFLKSVKAIQRRPDDKIIEPVEMDLRGSGHLLLTTRFGPLDLLAVIEKGLGYRDLLPHTIEIGDKGHALRFLSLETMIQLKRETDDPEEQYRFQVYEETLRMMTEK